MANAPRIIRAVLAVILIFGIGYTIAGTITGLGPGASAVWAVILMLIYGPPVLLFSAIIAFACRSRARRVSVALLATAACAAAGFVLAAHAAVAIVLLVGSGTALLLALLPPRAAALP